jgi:hypothetical protein
MAAGIVGAPLAGSVCHPKRFRFLNAERFGTILAVQPFAARSPRKIKNLPLLFCISR